MMSCGLNALKYLLLVNPVPWISLYLEKGESQYNAYDDNLSTPCLKVKNTMMHGQETIRFERNDNPRLLTRKLNSCERVLLRMHIICTTYHA